MRKSPGPYCNRQSSGLPRRTVHTSVIASYVADPATPRGHEVWAMRQEAAQAIEAKAQPLKPIWAPALPLYRPLLPVDAHDVVGLEFVRDSAVANTRDHGGLTPRRKSGSPFRRA